MLDGEFSDWTTTNTAEADGRYIYLHFSPDSDFPHTIQAAPHTTRIHIDATPQNPENIDLLIELSPKNELGSIGIGSKVTEFSDDGHPTAVGHASVGFMFLPTFGSNEFEARIDRLAPGAVALQLTGTISIAIDQIGLDQIGLDQTGLDQTTLWSTTMQVDLPPLAVASDPFATLPTKPDNSVRIMSSNVLFSSPLTNPDAFARVLDAIEPDVILYQEWFKTDVKQVENWIKTYAGSQWNLHMTSSRAGVAIATRHKIIERYESVIPSSGTGSGTGRPARAVAALIETDAGELLAISIHLKCCGAADSEEDHKRIAQAQAINAFVREVHQAHPNAKVVIAGDFNLVGSFAPMDTMTKSLGITGQDLSIVNAKQLANNSMITWNDEKSRFSPGRLDWMLIDESMSTATNSFILDTRSLSQESLDAMGLQADDSKASDHLPIVIDLVATE